MTPPARELSDHDELAGAIPALVLGALSGDEHRQVRLHLDSCASCQEMAARLAMGAAALALEPDPVEPPARLLDRVLTAIAAGSQEGPARTRRRPLTWHRRARHPFRGTGEMAGVSGRAVLLRQDDRALVDLKNLPQLTADQVYELWLLTADGETLPVAVFVPDAQGSKVVVVTRDLKGVRQLAVTVERGPNGSAVPSQQAQLSASIV